jgi:uncharacterized protein (DUF2336 family)
MTGNTSLMGDLERAMATRSGQRRSDTLRKVTDLFIENAPSYGSDHVMLFDDVMGRLVEDGDVAAKAELSERLASIDNAPPKLVDRLAADDMIDVAGPVLASSNRLSERQLAAIAASKSRRHLMAIAGRRNLSGQVTDTLLARGDGQVARTVATNAGAALSDKGYDKLAELAASDPSLAECLVVRADIPHRHFRTLVAIAPEPVRRRLANTNPRLAERIRQAIVEAEQENAQAVQRDYARAKATVKSLLDAGGLTDEAVLGFAKAGQFEETVVALAVLVRLSIDAVSRLMTSEPTDTVLIAAKAAGLTWPTVKHLVVLRTAARASPDDLESARLNFLRLKPETARAGLLLYKTRIARG